MNSGTIHNATASGGEAGHEMPRYVVAFPEWPQAIRERIDAVRAAHDPQAGLIAPHLTLVFGVRGITETALTRHLRQAVADTKPFDIHLDTLRLHREGPHGWVYWSVGDGAPDLHCLHAAIHTGPLAGAHDPARPFDPHITLASGPNATALQSLVESEAASWPDCRVTLEALWIGSIAQSRFVSGSRVALGGAA